MRKTPCGHKWKEDELFACGALTMFEGKVDDMGQTTLLVCTLCGEHQYVPKDVLNRVNLLK